MRKFFFIYRIVKIKDWKSDDRPREKMINSGTSSLSDAELLAILINSGTKDLSAVDLSRKILSYCDNSLNKLSQYSFEFLCSIDGIGEAKAARLIALFELSARIQSEKPIHKGTIVSSRSVADIFIPMLKNLPHEECWVLYLNRANKILAKERLSIGGISSTIMDSKMIIKRAVEKLASSIIIVHNHPSGNPYPGEQDKRQTALLKEAASLFDIALIDHIIIAGNNYYSFSDEGIG